MKMSALGRAAGLAMGAAATVASIALAVAPASSAAVSRSTAAATARVLKEGMSGTDVLALQHKLWSMHYWTGQINGKFTHDTTEAVWAFQAINGLKEDGVVGATTASALAHPRAYKPQYASAAATRIEVNINKNVQVLVLYKNHSIALISHISSAGGYRFCDSHGCQIATTPKGTYRAHSFIAGQVTVPLGVMYNPVFFIGTSFAIHGDTSVPVNPASHGCVRIPLNLSTTFHKLITVSYSSGTQIDIYDRAGVQHS
jgi:peptidoglycan hydrolase-like protein with peptidoglycan-binding domain